MAPPTIPQPTVCLVTDRRLCPGGDLVAKVADAVKHGVNMVQLREKDLPGGRLLALAQEFRDALGDSALLIVNERVDVAMLSGADGVHLGEAALDPAAARKLAGPDMLIGRSVHDLDGAERAQRRGAADYLIAGAVFPTGSHSGARAQGLEFLQRLAPKLHVPYLAIGGVNAGNAAEVMAAGAAGVAVISAILASERPGAAAAALRRVVDDAWAVQTRHRAAAYAKGGR